MTTNDQGRSVHPNVKTFAAIFFFICGVVGVVLCVANLAQKPMSVGHGIFFGVIGVVGLLCGWLTTRKPRY